MPNEPPIIQREENPKPFPVPLVVSLIAGLILIAVLALLLIRVPTTPGKEETIPLWQSIAKNLNIGTENPADNSGINNSNAGTGNQGGKGRGGGGGGSGGAGGAGGGGAGGGSTGGTTGGTSGGSGGGGGGGGGGSSGGKSESGTGSSCGDGLCTSTENCVNCPADCGHCPDTSCTDNNGTCQSTCGFGFVPFPPGDAQCQPSQICCVLQGGQGSVCGNNILEPGEACECGPNGVCGDSDDNLNGHTCQTEGFEYGVLYCNPSCTGFNTNECVPFWER